MSVTLTVTLEDVENKTKKNIAASSVTSNTGLLDGWLHSQQNDVVAEPAQMVEPEEFEVQIQSSEFES